MTNGLLGPNMRRFTPRNERPVKLCRGDKYALLAASFPSMVLNEFAPMWNSNESNFTFTELSSSSSSSLSKSSFNSISPSTRSAILSSSSSARSSHFLENSSPQASILSLNSSLHSSMLSPKRSILASNSASSASIRASPSSSVRVPASTKASTSAIRAASLVASWVLTAMISVKAETRPLSGSIPSTSTCTSLVSVSVKVVSNGLYVEADVESPDNRNKKLKVTEARVCFIWQSF